MSHYLYPPQPFCIFWSPSCEMFVLPSNSQIFLPVNEKSTTTKGAIEYWLQILFIQKLQISCFNKLFRTIRGEHHIFPTIWIC